MTIVVILLILAFICAVLAALGVSSRVPLTALGLLLVVIALLIGSVG
jgi:hypothetical protein